MCKQGIFPLEGEMAQGCGCAVGQCAEQVHGVRVDDASGQWSASDGRAGRIVRQPPRHALFILYRRTQHSAPHSIPRALGGREGY